MRSLVLGAVDVAVKLAVVALALYPLLDPASSHFTGKAMGVRALVYPAFTLLIPAVWLASRRPVPYPFAADIALGLPFLIDAGANVFGLFEMAGFDAIPHAVGWLCLSSPSASRSPRCSTGDGWPSSWWSGSAPRSTSCGRSASTC